MGHLLEVELRWVNLILSHCERSSFEFCFWFSDRGDIRHLRVHVISQSWIAPSFGCSTFSYCSCVCCWIILETVLLFQIESTWNLFTQVGYDWCIRFYGPLFGIVGQLLMGLRDNFIGSVHRFHSRRISLPEISSSSRSLTRSSLWHLISRWSLCWVTIIKFCFCCNNCGWRFRKVVLLFCGFHNSLSLLHSLPLCLVGIIDQWFYIMSLFDPTILWNFTLSNCTVGSWVLIFLWHDILLPPCMSIQHSSGCGTCSTWLWRLSVTFRFVFTNSFSLFSFDFSKLRFGLDRFRFWTLR